jgi:hypothetical protein
MLNETKKEVSTITKDHVSLHSSYLCIATMCVSYQVCIFVDLCSLFKLLCDKKTCFPILMWRDGSCDDEF